MKLLDGLNEAQQRAVTSTNPVILCLAGAGTGKTRTLTHRIAYLHQEKRVGTSNMLALTFTRLSGKEMKERIMQLVGEDQGKKLFCNTFHAFSVMVLRDWGFKLGIDKNFTIYDQEDREAILRQIIADFGNRTNLSKVMARFEQFKDFRDEQQLYPEECRVLIEYGYRLRQNNAVDLDRLIDLVNKIWQKYPDVLAEYKKTYSHVFVDEFQDTNEEQMQLIELLHPENLFVVGDDFQSIYGWRGAQVEFIIDLPRYRPDCDVIKLEENYRSTHQIVQAANRLITFNQRQTRKVLRAHESGPDISVSDFENQGKEAERIALKISWLRSKGIQFRDIAVLARTNAQVQLIENIIAIKAPDIPTQLVSNSDDPFKKRDISLLLAWLDVICNRKDTINLKRVLNFPQQYLSQLQIQQAELFAMQHDLTLFEALHKCSFQADTKVSQFLKKVMDLEDALSNARFPSEAFKTLVSRLGIGDMYQYQGLKNRVQDAEKAYSRMQRWEQSKMAMGEDCSVQAFLKWLRYRDIQEKIALQNDDEVKLMTVHASKGLEFRAVIVAGMNQGVFPSRRTHDLEEERRLFYVAITRAKEHLIITRPEVIDGYNGEQLKVDPSQFLAEMTGAPQLQLSLEKAI